MPALATLVTNPHCLSVASLNWSLEHHKQQGDTDLFPRLFEHEIIERRWETVRPRLAGVNIATHQWTEPRRLLVPKDHLIFRRGTQLDPIDSLLYAAIVREVGAQIEARRIPSSERRVFSSRFDPADSGRLYSQADFWSQFWKKSTADARESTHVVVCDISDFYQQIDHSIIRSQLELADVLPSFRAALLELLRVTSADTGRGVPVGPHASHLLAEMSLIPLDGMLRSYYPRFCRFIDDIHVFCSSAAEGERALYDIANVLDGTLHLATSGRKTRLLTAKEFLQQAEETVVRGDLAEEEAQILEVVKDATDSPYTFTSFEEIPKDKRDSLSQGIIEDVLEGYLTSKGGPDYPKIRWFLRRLSQVGAPGGVEFVVHNLSRLTPAMPDVAGYLRTAAGSFTGDWLALGDELIQALKYPIVERSEYLQLVVCSLFSRIADLNHFDKLASYFLNAHAIARREILLAARTSKAIGWLEANATTLDGHDPWEARAVLFAADALPATHRRRLAAEQQAGKPALLIVLLIEGLKTTDEGAASSPPAQTPSAQVAFRLELEPGKARFNRSACRNAVSSEYSVTWTTPAKARGDAIEGTTAQIDRLARDASGGMLDTLVKKHGAARVLSVRLVPSGEYRYDYVAPMRTVAPRIASVTSRRGRDELRNCRVLLVTTTNIERQVLLTYLKPPTKRDGILEFSAGRISYRIGRLGRYRCACVETKMGSQDREGSALTVQEAIDVVKPKAVIVVGIAFGINRTKQRLGDVLVATSIMPYELQKVSPAAIIQRGTEIQCGMILGERFRTRSADWRFPRHGDDVKVHQGLVLSGEKLIDNVAFRDRLTQEFATAVGGEMEGVGAYAAATRAGTEIILVKSICDWADGHKNDAAQPFAGHTAVKLVSHVLGKADVLQPLTGEN